MSSGGSSVELQTYDRHIQTFAATDQPDNPLDHEDYEADGTFGRPKNTQPLLPSSGSPVRVAIKRKPVSSTGFYSRSNTEARPPSTSISGTISEIEPVRIESMIRNPVNIDGEADSIHTEKDVSNFAPEGWPASPMTITKPSERNSGRILEICSYAFMGAMALGFLGTQSQKHQQSMTDLFSICHLMRQYEQYVSWNQSQVYWIFFTRALLRRYFPAEYRLV
jgi:hypothetical protein